MGTVFLTWCFSKKAADREYKRQLEIVDKEYQRQLEIVERQFEKQQEAFTEQTIRDRGLEVLKYIPHFWASVAEQSIDVARDLVNTRLDYEKLDKLHEIGRAGVYTYKAFFSEYSADFPHLEEITEDGLDLVSRFKTIARMQLLRETTQNPGYWNGEISKYYENKIKSKLAEFLVFRDERNTVIRHFLQHISAPLAYREEPPLDPPSNVRQSSHEASDE